MAAASHEKLKDERIAKPRDDIEWKIYEHRKEQRIAMNTTEVTPVPGKPPNCPCRTGCGRLVTPAAHWCARILRRHRRNSFDILNCFCSASCSTRHREQQCQRKQQRRFAQPFPIMLVAFFLSMPCCKRAFHLQPGLPSIMDQYYQIMDFNSREAKMRDALETGAERSTTPAILTRLTFQQALVRHHKCNPIALIELSSFRRLKIAHEKIGQMRLSHAKAPLHYTHRMAGVVEADMQKPPTCARSVSGVGLGPSYYTASLLWSPGPRPSPVFRSAICDCLSLNVSVSQKQVLLVCAHKMNSSSIGKS